MYFFAILHTEGMQNIFLNNNLMLFIEITATNGTSITSFSAYCVVGV